MSRLEKCFEDLKQQKRAGLITYITAGDPQPLTTEAILAILPEAGADIIELGMPFSDPVADGTIIQQASQRAILAKQKMIETFAMIRRFRRQNQHTPIILMGYYNPVYRYGVSRFIEDCVEAEVDGLIIVDLPFEHDDELCVPTTMANLAYIRLVTPTTTEFRLQSLLKGTANNGFLYYVSVAGITGTQAPDLKQLRIAVSQLKQRQSLPVAVGFGIRNAAQARAIGSFSDAVVVGSALVEKIAAAKNEREAIDQVKRTVKQLAQALQTQRMPTETAEQSS